MLIIKKNIILTVILTYIAISEDIVEFKIVWCIF